MITPPPYVTEIHRQFVDVFKLQEDPKKPDWPLHIPDGIYPMNISGKVDNVLVEDGNIHYCNFYR